MTDVVLTALVRVKKRDGRAELSEKYLRWTPDDASADPAASSGSAAKQIVVSWTTVQDQQVSSLSSPKAMIRLRMTTNNSATLVLEFISAKSLEQAFEVRDAAKELIAKWILASGKQQKQHASSSAARTPLCNATEIKQRAALLAANPTLKRQHMEMVNEGLISEEDFWASRRHLIANEASKRQKTGKTSAILTDLSGDNDTGGNVVKYNLNAEVIHQIFIQYPAVHLAYQSQVPDKMTETEFWSAFFKSKYFHRDRKAGHEDMFTKYEEKEKEMSKGTTVDPRAVVDPLVDLTSTEEDFSTLQRGMSKKQPLAKDDGSTITIAKFNRHGAYVLDPSHAGKLQGNPEASLMMKSRPNFHDNLREATLLDDLQGKQPPPYNPLTLEDESRYFQQQTLVDEGLQTGSLADAANQFQRICRETLLLTKAFPTAKTSLDILNEIVSCSDSGADTSSSSSSGAFGSGAMTAEYIPTEFKKQVYNQFHDVNELLRHFLSFKAKVAQGGDTDAQHKLNKIVEKMGSKYDELVKIRENLPPHEKNLLAPLLKPFDDQLNLAFI